MKLKWHIWQRTELLSGLTLVAFNYMSQAGTDLGGKNTPGPLQGVPLAVHISNPLL